MTQVTQPPTTPQPSTGGGGPARTGQNWLPVVRVATAVVALLVIVVGAVVVVSTFFQREKTETRTFAGTVGAVRVTEDVGDVRVRVAGPGETTRVTSRITKSFDDATWSADLRGGTLVVDGSCRERGFSFFGCSVDLTVVVPAGIPVSIESDTGDLAVTGAFAQVDARSSTGDVLVQQATGPVRIQTNSGDVRSLATSSTTVSAETSTGDVRLSFDVVPQNVSAETNTGDVTVLLPDDGTAYAVATDTDTGDVAVDVTNIPTEQRGVVARTDTGDVRVSYR